MADEESSEEEQALRASSAAAPAPATCRVRRAERVITGALPLTYFYGEEAVGLFRCADHTGAYARSKSPVASHELG
ncbi:hypothetical protein GCM10022403_016850 [Streptomyces coacervatus]|uniref:Uncharacterized protein n=1 Tax=Streptomyces coacervatus TaxID=647381 RepID=A0ABP7H2R0_9ACTN